MENKTKRIFEQIDLIIKEVDSVRIEPKFSEEIKKRNQRNPYKIRDDNDVLERMARLIAFSQNAPSDRVSDMLKKGNFKKIFCNFEVDKVIKNDPNRIIDRHWDEIKAVRFKKKINSIIGCANSLHTIKLKHGSFKALLNTLPIKLNSESDIERF